MIGAAVLAWALRAGRAYLPYIAGFVAIFAVYLWVDHQGYRRGIAHDAPVIAKLNAHVADLTATIANVRAKTAAAIEADRQHALAVQTTDARITKENADALATSLADTDARYRALVDGLRRAYGPASADPGRGEASHLPGAADAASGLPGAAAGDTVPTSAAALMECERNTDKLLIGQAWWTNTVAARGAELDTAPRP